MAGGSVMTGYSSGAGKPWAPATKSKADAVAEARFRSTFPANFGGSAQAPQKAAQKVALVERLRSAAAVHKAASARPVDLGKLLDRTKAALAKFAEYDRQVDDISRRIGALESQEV